MHAQGVLLGFGERCGNTNLFTLLADLQLKLGYECIDESQMRQLRRYAMEASEICDVAVPGNAPYIGNFAFAHKAGMHIDGVLKESATFEHVSPQQVGNNRDMLISEVAGRGAVLQRLIEIFPDIDIGADQLQQLTDILKQKEHEGYQYEGASASFELLMRRVLGRMEQFFSVDYYKVISEVPDDESLFSAMAAIKVDVKGKKLVTAYEGKGPVNALDGALRKALEVFYAELSQMHLVDYKVRVIDSAPATASRVRVMIESSDGHNRWRTVGVSSDVLEASLQAVSDSIEYKLLLEDAKG